MSLILTASAPRECATMPRHSTTRTGRATAYAGLAALTRPTGKVNSSRNRRQRQQNESN
jgi:hypothetical protein